MFVALQQCYCLTLSIHGWLQARLGCNSELILDEFGEKLLEELDYQQEARNIEVCTCLRIIFQTPAQ